MNLGQEIAHGLGVNVTIISLLACVVGIILCAVTTALSGPIGFIGLLVTHFTRYLAWYRFEKNDVACAGSWGVVFTDC
nr:iron chelate uptake ABC transporter family permease subunit [Ligilactobacillus salitolerans]